MQIPTKEEIKQTIDTAEQLIESVTNPADKVYLKTVIDTLEWTIGKNDSPIVDYI